MILWWLVLWLFFVLSFSEVHVEVGCGFLMAVTVVTSSSGILFLSIAPFTLTFEWGDPASIFRFLVCVKVSDDRSSTGTQYWGSRPVWMVKAVVQSGVVSVWWCGNYICPSLNKIKRKVAQSNIIWTNNSNIVTVTVFNCLQLIWGKKYCSNTWINVCQPVCPTHSSSHFCPKNIICHWPNILTH